MTYSANAKAAQRYGFVLNNTGTIGNAYWYAAASAPDPTTGNPTATVPTDTSPAKNLTAAQAADFASYTAFDPSIWGIVSSESCPVLRNIPIYVYQTDQNGTTYYGMATSDAMSLQVNIAGLQGGDQVNAQANPVRDPFILATDNGYVDAGIWSP